jgi:hypothetical protein
MTSGKSTQKRAAALAGRPPVKEGPHRDEVLPPSVDIQQGRLGVFDRARPHKNQTTGWVFWFRLVSLTIAAVTLAPAAILTIRVNPAAVDSLLYRVFLRNYIAKG